MTWFFMRVMSLWCLVDHLYQTIGLKKSSYLAVYVKAFSFTKDGGVWTDEIWKRHTSLWSSLNALSCTRFSYVDSHPSLFSLFLRVGLCSWMISHVLIIFVLKLYVFYGTTWTTALLVVLVVAWHYTGHSMQHVYIRFLNQHT